MQIHDLLNTTLFILKTNSRFSQLFFHQILYKIIDIIRPLKCLLFYIKSHAK